MALYLHRGAFENALADEDQEQEPDRWCSHAAWGQECWLIISQWVWNLRLELGHALDPAAMRTTEFAPALLPVQVEAADFPSSSLGYGPAEQALPWKRSRFSGRDFIPQPDGTLRCPAGQLLFAQERLARNARAPTAGQVTIKLFGVPEAFATFLGLPTA